MKISKIEKLFASMMDDLAYIKYLTYLTEKKEKNFETTKY